jgi:predicted MFS family arabinose efflux permease
MEISPVKKYGTLLSLYIAQSIPMSFFSTVVPVIMRQEEYSLASIGLLQLVKIPWIIKFFWAPLVDKTSHSLRDYKKWIFFSELFYALIILSTGFFKLSTDFSTIVILMVAAFVLSATQDIASDALAIRILRSKQRGFGNSMQAAGSFLGTMVGSGVLLMLYPKIGWQGLTILLAGFVMIALTPLFTFVRKEHEPPAEARPKVKWVDLFGFFTQKGIWRRLILLMFFYSGILGMLVIFKPFMVDLGFKVPKIAFIAGIYGTGIGACCTILAGWFLRKWGTRKTMIGIAAFNVITPIFFLVFHLFSLHSNWIYVGSALLWGGYGMASVTIYTASMNIVRKGLEGTDFTIQIVITHLSGLIMAIVAGRIGDALGYEGLFTMELILGLLVLIFVPMLFRERDDHKPTGHHHHSKGKQPEINHSN